MKQLRTISIVWGLSIFVLFAVLSFFAIQWKNNIYPYTQLEKNLVEATKKYYEMKYSYPSEGQSKFIEYDELKENNMINELKKDDDECSGFVKVTKNRVVEYKAFIKCNKYTTKEYDKNIELINKK